MNKELQEIIDKRLELMDCVTRPRGITESGLEYLAKQLACDASTNAVYKALEDLGKRGAVNSPDPQPDASYLHKGKGKGKKDEAEIPDELDSAS